MLPTSPPRPAAAGTYEMEFSHYEEVPPPQAEKIVAQAKAQKEAE